MLKKNVCEGIHWIEDGYVNFYLVQEGDELTVVDAGLPSSWKELIKAVASLGLTLQSIKALVLTHAHFDHLGFASKLQGATRIPIWVHTHDEWLAAHPLRYAHERNRLYYLLRYPGSLRPIFTMAAKGAFFVKGVTQVRTYQAGQQLDVPGRPLVISTPGHTSGHCAMHFRQHSCVIAGDAIVTFNPYTGRPGPQIVSGAATADSQKALLALDSLAATQAQTLLVGHGEPWTSGVEQAVYLARRAGPS